MDEVAHPYKNNVVSLVIIPLKEKTNKQTEKYISKYHEVTFFRLLKRII